MRVTRRPTDEVNGLPKKKQPGEKKKRTREHVISDLSVNHVERHALRCGFSVERVRHDYGVDLILFTYGPEGEPENGEVFLQVKATDHLQVLSEEEVIPCRVRQADLRSWLGEPMPVILILYDAKADRAYWLYVQAYFENLIDFNLGKAGAEITVRIPRRNALSRAAMKRFSRYRDEILSQTDKVIRHHE
jgi:Domain of unknown function (DUF4365)